MANDGEWVNGSPGKRWRLYEVSCRVLLAEAREGVHPAFQVTKDPMPADATVVRAQLCFMEDAIQFIVESAEFDIVPDGETVPVIRPVFSCQLEAVPGD